MKKMNVSSTITKAASFVAAGVLAFGLTACGNADTKETDATQNTEASVENNTENNTETKTDDAATTEANSDAAQNAGEAATVTITIQVTDADGNTTDFTGTTDDEFLLGAISDIEGVTIDGSESDWGFYVTTVNEIVADYDACGSYWALYVNGAYGENGVSTQPVAEGDVYSFVYTVDKTASEITIEVTGPDGETATFTGSTDDEFLFDAISDIEGVTIDGYESDWGFYITTVNDIVADYDTDGAYWSIYVNGAYGENGVSTQPITAGDVYSFVYEKYTAAN